MPLFLIERNFAERIEVTKDSAAAVKQVNDEIGVCELADMSRSSRPRCSPRRAGSLTLLLQQAVPHGEGCGLGAVGRIRLCEDVAHMVRDGIHAAEEDARDFLIALAGGD